MARDFDIGDRQLLPADADRVYMLITRGEPVPEGDAGTVEEMVRLGFVALDSEQGNRPVALDPRTVGSRLMAKMLEENAARIAHMSELPAVTDQLAAHFEGAQWRAGGGSEYLDDPNVVNARLDDVVAAAEWEILAAQPLGPRDEMQLNRSLARDTAALDRGVAKKTLYRVTVRDNAVTARYARQMGNRSVGRSAEFRTWEGAFERCIIVDRKTAFISNHLVKGAPAHSAWQVTDPAMVAYIAAEFEAKWDRADPWHGELRGRQAGSVVGSDGVRTTRRQREILRDLAAGKSQRATAAGLGVSERTVSDEITTLRDLFDARSREQLVFKWAFSPDRLVDDSAPDQAAGAVTTTAAA